jgi:hypothetical protein
MRFLSSPQISLPDRNGSTMSIVHGTQQAMHIHRAQSEEAWFSCEKAVSLYYTQEPKSGSQKLSHCHFTCAAGSLNIPGNS